jgi:hypothetical protein
VNTPTLMATPILDYEVAAVRTLGTRLRGAGVSPRSFVQTAHGYLGSTLHAVYSIDEYQSASRTLATNRGSCSQRMACLEAIARAGGVATRVRAVWLAREFWFSRLPLLRLFLPRRILMPWPQFNLDDGWVDFSEIYGSTAELARAAPHPFTNRGESMFDAVAHVPVDYFGTATACGYPAFDLTRYVVGEDGIFDTRDLLLKEVYDKPTWGAKLLFHLTYEGRPIRRQPE